MYIGDYLTRRCVYTPDKVAIVDATADATVRHTYREMNLRANALAFALQARQIEKGDRVAMLAHDGPHFYDAFFACGKIGAVFVPYNWRLHPREVADQISLTAPKILLHSNAATFEPILQHLRGCTDRPDFWPLDGDAPLSNHDLRPEKCETLTEDDTACLLFTGGSTGAPKAAQISHKQVVWNTFNALLGDVLGTDTFLNIFPMFHAGGLFAFSIPMLILGGTIVQTSTFEPERTLALMAQEAVTIFGGVPTIFQMLTEADNWEKADLTSLRYCLSGGAPLPVDLIEKYRKQKGVVFRQGFGMTEFGPDVFSLASEDAVRKAGSIGKPNFFVDAKIVVSATGEPAGPGEVGELLLRGPSACSGYFNNPGETGSAFDGDNYFHTGDLASVDDEGYFFIVDRLKDMFISGGENVYPAEIEAVLHRYAGVSLCAVIGIDDARWGQVGCAFVTASPGANVDPDAVIAFLADNLAKYKVPKKVMVMAELPISGAGKVLKTELRKLVTNND